MSRESGASSTRKWALVAAGVGLVYVLVRHRQKLLKPLQRVLPHGNILRNRRVEVINSAQDPATQLIIKELKQ